MAKFKAAKGKKKETPRPPAAISCVVLVLVGIALVMIFGVLFLKYATR